MDLPPDLSRIIADAARRLSIARNILDRAKTFEERQLAQIEFDAAEKAMIDASMKINRGLERATSA